MRRLGLALGLLALASVGCRAKGSGVAPEAGPPPMSAMKPSPLLELARSERHLAAARADRRATGTRRTAAPAPDGSEVEGPDATDAEATTDDHEGTSSDDTTRKIVVRTPRLATWESLARYALRHAEKRRPRRLHEPRFLVRVAKTGTKGADVNARARVRRRLVDNRDEIKRCIIAAEARRPDVVVKAPSALVVEQAARRGRDTVRFDVFFGPSQFPGVSADDDVLDSTARRCIGEAMRGSKDEDDPPMMMPVVAFVQEDQQTFGGADGLHSALAAEAASIGWLHYERGEYEDALSYYEDAYWLLHLADYKALIGMAHEALGHDEEAAFAYADYVAARTNAPDALSYRAKIRLLSRAP